MMQSPEERVQAAAHWLVQQKEPPHPAVPTLRGKFTLTMKQACDACRIAADLRRARP